VRRFFRYLPLLVLLTFCVSFANAQSGLDLNIGFGAVQDKASPTGIDQNTLLGCTPPGSGTCSATPSLSGFMLGFGMDLMLWKHLGAGFEVNLQPGKQNYANLQPQIVSIGQPGISLQSRVTFYDFNAIAEPVNTKKALIKLEGGIGGANIKFYETGSTTDALVGSSTFTQYYGSSNHFQIHAGAGVQIYVTDHIFVRPQFDIHWVNNLSQFGSNLVKEETVWLGYSWGDRP
jgi:opacity protein-like surface antigen